MTEPSESPRLNSPAVPALVGSLLVVAVVSSIPLAVANLQADDYCRATRVGAANVFDCVQHDYQSFTGRWLGFGIEYLILSFTQSSPGYGIALGAIGLLYFASLALLISALFPQSQISLRLLWAGLLWSLYWVGLPSTKDTYYWLCGSVEYQLSMAAILFTIAATLLATSKCTTGRGCLRWRLAAMLGALAATGMHELYGLMLCLTLTVGSGLAFSWKSPARSIWASVAGCAIFGFLFVFLAPGNAARSAANEHSGEFWRASQVAISALLQALPDWIFDFRLMAATLLFIASAPARHFGENLPDRDRLRALRWASLGLWLVLLGGSFFGPAWGTGTIVASRTLSAAYMIFLIGWFLNWLLLVAWLQAQLPQPMQLPAGAKSTLIVLLAASLVFTGNSRRAVRETLGPIPRYVEAKDHWRALLREASQSGAREVELPAIAHPPSLIGFSDPAGNPRHWLNRCVAEYYGLDAVWVRYD